MGWLSGTDSVHPSAAISTGEPQLRASFGCQIGLNHWTHLVQKAPKANRQELVHGLPSGNHLCSSPGSISGLPPRGGCLSVLPQPSSDSTAAGTTGGLCLPRAPYPLPDGPSVQLSPPPCVLVMGDLSPQGEGRPCQR